jgi:predicted nucleic acid-binding protein
MFSVIWMVRKLMAGIVFDTSVYISSLRRGDPTILNLRRANRPGDGSSQPLWLSAVVLSELLVGAADKRARALLLELERAFVRVNRLLVPLQSDWRLTGEVLSLVGAKYGYEQVGRTRMTNDALISMSVARSGFTVLTKNAADFRMIAEFRPFKWEQV